MSRICALLLAGAACLVFVRATSAQDWPAWRGPQANGVSTEKVSPTTWSKEENVKWKLELDGDGPTPPVVQGPFTFSQAQSEQNAALVEHVVAMARPAERRVLELRYGLGGEHPRTLDEVGRTFNVTRERIRQIENQSLKKLQSLNEAQKLREAT